MTATAPPRRTCAFGPISVDYDERVLAPRAWTLEQSHWAADLAAAARPGPLLELCAGAGHIGLAAAVLCGRDLIQVELDPIAGGYARFNAERAGVGRRVTIRTGRMQDVLRAEERFPLILADPPYLPTDDVTRWPDDPIGAIDGGPDGLQLVRDCVDLGARHLTSAGRLLLQVAGPAQADAVSPILGRELAVIDRRVVDAARAIVLVART